MRPRQLDPVVRAMSAYRIPAGHENFVFVMPALFVAQADGNICEEEVYQLLWRSYVTSHLDADEHHDEHVFERFVMDASKRTVTIDLQLVADAIDAQLVRFRRDEAEDVRKWIRGLCKRVAKASGESFFRRVSVEEMRMLERIFAELDEHEQDEG